MERPFMHYQSLQDSGLHFGGGAGRGRETAMTRHYVNVVARQAVGFAGDLTGPEVDLCIELTVPQMAQIVKLFFSEITVYPLKNIYANFLRRLLRHRWAAMTSGTAKSDLFPEFRLAPYHDQSHGREEEARQTA